MREVRGAGDAGAARVWRGGADVLSTVLVMEGLGYGCHDNGLIFSLNAQMWSLGMPLVKFGSPAQRQAYPPGLVSGDLIGVHAMTEPDSGSDAFNMRTRVERRGDSYVLNGTKLYITNAPVADVVLVFALHPGRTSMAGVSAFLVDKGTPLWTSPMGEVALTDCVVPAGKVPDELLGSRLRAVISAASPGLTRDEVLDHCRQRLPAYMVPDVVEFCEALPRTSTGKVDRAGLARHGT